MIYNSCYYWQIIAWDSYAESSSGPVWNFTTVDEPNEPPTAPVISGPTNGKAGVEYEYTFVTTDSNDDEIYLWINWGDGCPAVEWIGPYTSGEIITVDHTFENQGDNKSSSNFCGY